MRTKATSLYRQNRIYISDEEQEKIRKYKVLIGGAGLGSVIVECALRLGFENICIIDGEHVEESNLNIQNYIAADVEKPKTEALYKRLKEINPNADVKYHSIDLNDKNIYDFITNEYDIAINSLDFTSNVPFLFDQICLSKNIPILHPYNFGWAGCVFVINNESLRLDIIQEQYENFEYRFATHVTKYLRHWNNRKEWLEHVLDVYSIDEETSPPQLAVASWIAAGICTNVLFNIATQKKVKVFPEFYLSSII